MNLGEYMKINHIKIVSMAKELGVSYMYLSSIKHGKRKPSLSLANKIELITGGQVTISDVRGHE